MLIMGHGTVVDLAWVCLVAVALFLVGRRFWLDAMPPAQRASSGRRPIDLPVVHRLALRSMLLVDRRVVLGDRVLLMVLGGIPGLALGVRLLLTVGSSWVRERWGVDVDQYTQVILGFVLVIHTPVMIGSIVGLLFLEDRDAGVLPGLLVTRTSLAGLVRYRTSMAWLLGAISVPVGSVLAGSHHPGGVAAVVLTAIAAGGLSATVALSMACFGRDRVQGMAFMKAMGVPLYLPVAMWFTSWFGKWALLLVPSAWPLQSWWAPSPGQASLWASASILISVGSIAAFSRRLERTLVT
jgi:fluoroquinolone transport system permease protein